MARDRREVRRGLQLRWGSGGGGGRGARGHCHHHGASCPARISRVEEIKTQLDARTWQERCKLNALLQSWPDEEWDRQVTSGGKFDRVNEEAATE